MSIQKRSNPVWIAAALGLASLALAVPGVQAAKPTRTTRPPGSETLEAGKACPFDVIKTELPGTTFKTTIFSDGREQEKRKGRVQFTNAATGQSVIVKLAVTVTFEERGGITFFESSGIGFTPFLPGDQTDFGTIGEDGALLRITGHVEGAFGPPDDLFLFYSLNGQKSDICDLIS